MCRQDSATPCEKQMRERARVDFAVFCLVFYSQPPKPRLGNLRTHARPLALVPLSSRSSVFSYRSPRVDAHRSSKLAVSVEFNGRLSDPSGRGLRSSVLCDKRTGSHYLPIWCVAAAGWDRAGARWAGQRGARRVPIPWRRLCIVDR